MANLTDYVIKWLKADNAAENESVEMEKNTVADSVSSADTLVEVNQVSTVAQDSPAADLPTYTATLAQIEKWHSYGGLGALQNLLLPYDLGYGSFDKAFEKFKIGYDVKGHAATFALDNSHCYKIFFNVRDAFPIDDLQAEKVLQKINSLRAVPVNRLKWYERRRAPCFNSAGKPF